MQPSPILIFKGEISTVVLIDKVIVYFYIQNPYQIHLIQYRVIHIYIERSTIILLFIVAWSPVFVLNKSRTYSKSCVYNLCFTETVGGTYSIVC